MAADKRIEITYGDFVRVQFNNCSSTTTGSVVGITKVTDKFLEKYQGAQIGDVYFLVETSDGSTIEAHHDKVELIKKYSD